MSGSKRLVIGKKAFQNTPLGPPAGHIDPAAGDYLAKDTAARHIGLQADHAAHAGKLYCLPQLGQQVCFGLGANKFAPGTAAGVQGDLVGGQSGQIGSDGLCHLQAVFGLVDQVKQIVPILHGLRQFGGQVGAQPPGLISAKCFHQ